MRLTVLGARGAWPGPGEACSGFLFEHEGFRLVVDLGYATLPRLLELIGPGDVDAVVVSHGHPDHCVDLNPLLRARVDESFPRLPVYAPPGALDAVLALDRRGWLDDSLTLHDLDERADTEIGPFHLGTAALPHSRPNLGLRLSAGGRTCTYTGDCGPDPAVVRLAEGTDLFLAETSFVDTVPDRLVGSLSSARDVGREAREAEVGRLLLTHLMAETDPDRAMEASEHEHVEVAASGFVVDI